MLGSMIRGHYCEEAYNRDMNGLFVKLHLLDPQSVIPAYQHLLNQKGESATSQVAISISIEQGDTMTLLLIVKVG